MTLSSIWVDLQTKGATAEVSIDSTDQAAVPTPGNIGRSSIANLDLSNADDHLRPGRHTVTVLNATATLQAVTAATLNDVFVGTFEKSRRRCICRGRLARRASPSPHRPSSTDGQRGH